MASTKNRGLTAREAVLTYCTSWTQEVYLNCWPRLHEVAPDATTKEKEDARLLVECEVMAMLRHEIPEQDDTASASEPMREPTVLEITGDLGSDSEPEIMAGSFLGTYGELDIDTTGHWTYRAGETRLRELKENGPDFIHYDRFFVTREDGSGQRLRIVLSRCRNDKVKETKANMFDDGRVPAESGEDNETILRLAASRDFIRKLPDPDPDPFGEPAPVRLWVEGRPGDDMPPREVTQDELRHLRLYPERDELSGGGLRFEGLLFFNAAERLPVDKTKGSDNAAPVSDNETTHPKLGGRPTYETEIQEAGRYLLDNNEIGPTASWKTIGYNVRKRVQEQVKTTDDKTTDDKGLDDQTIRRHLKAIFDAHGKARD